MTGAPFQAQMSPEEMAMLMQLMQQQQMQGNPSQQFNAPPMEMPPGAPVGLPDAGLGPVTPDSMAGQPNPSASPFEPTGGQNAGLALRQGMEGMGMPGLGDRLGQQAGGTLDYGSMPARGYADQFGRATGAVSEAIGDPSISNIANAGVQTGATAGSLPLMAGSAALGFGDAAVRQLGPFVGEAEAQQRGRGGRQQASAGPVPDLPGLPPEHMAGYKDAMGRMMRGQFRTGAERRALESQVQMYRDMVGKAAEGQREQQQGEYNRRVEGAEAARDKELSRDRRFSETPVGEFYNKMGGLAPFAAAGLAGVAGRLAHGTPKGMAGKFALPYVEGAGAAYGMTNLPDMYNAFMTEPDNPQQKAQEAYGRGLPAGHPRKQEATDAAASMPKSNPIRDAATANLTSPRVMGARGVAAGIEGLTGPIGSGLAGAPTRITRELRGNAASRRAATSHRGVSPSAQTPAQRSAAAASGRDAQVAYRADMDRRISDPATAQWFADNPGKGHRAYNAAHGTSFNAGRFERLRSGIEGQARDAALRKAANDIGGTVTQAQAAQLKQVVPELKNMSPKAIQSSIKRMLSSP